MPANYAQSQKAWLRTDLSERLSFGGENFPCVGVVALRNRLHVIARSPAEESAEAVLVVAGKGLPLTVSRCQEDQKNAGTYHILLESKDPSHNLIREFQEENLVAHPTASEKSDDEAKARLDAKKVKELLGPAHTPDRTALEGTPLAKLAKHYRAYPINHEGMSLMALIPAAYRPKDVAEIADEELPKYVVVLRSKKSMGTQHWEKFWPQPQEQQAQGSPA